MGKCCLLLLTLLFSELTFAQTNQYADLVKYYHAEKNFNGTVLVATNGQIDYLGGIGLANRQTGTKISTNSIFKIASITKAFTAVLTMQLYEQGKLDLYIPFGKYFPGYKGDAKDKVTIDQLLTYSSGIPDESRKFDMKSYELPITLDEYIDKYCSSNIVNKPGDTSIYSNTEYIILTKIIENVTQKKFDKVLEDGILKPLKMEHTGMLTANSKIKNLVTSYTIDDSTKAVTPDEPYYSENFFGSGAMYSSIEDLLRFDEGIFKNKLLTPSTTALLIKPHPKLNNAAFGVWYANGYGIFSKPFIYRTGGILGSCSNWIHTLDDKKTIIVFNNTDGTNLYGMSEQLYLIATGNKPTIEETKK